MFGAVLRDYFNGMEAYKRCAPPNLREKWGAFTGELQEFLNEPSPEEFFDVLHSGGDVVYRLTGIPLQLLAWPTVKKHALRYRERGCIRSDRNCCGKTEVPTVEGRTPDSESDFR